MVVPQEGQHGDDALRVDEDFQLLLPCHLDLLHVPREHLLNVAAKVGQLSNALLFVCLHHGTYKESTLEKENYCKLGCGDETRVICRRRNGESADRSMATNDPHLQGQTTSLVSRCTVSCTASPTRDSPVQLVVLRRVENI